MTKQLTILTAALGLLLIFGSYIAFQNRTEANALNGTFTYAGVPAPKAEKSKTKARSHSAKIKAVLSCGETNAREQIRDVPYRQCPKEMRLQYSNEGGRIAADPDTVYQRDEFVPCRVKQCQPDARSGRIAYAENIRLFESGKIVSCVIGKKRLMSGQFVEVREMVTTKSCPKNNRRNVRYKGILGPDVATLP